MQWMSRALFVFAFFFAAGCGQPVVTAVEDARPVPFESPYFTVSVSGAGPDVILMPGLASSAAVWDDTVAALNDRYRFHVVQVSGFAGAPARGNADNLDILDDLAAGLASYSRSLDQAPAIVGHSLGGIVTLKAALDPDSKLDRIVIVDVLPFFSVLMDDQATSDSIAPVAAIMKAGLLAQSEDVFAVRQAEALGALVKGEDDLQKALTWSIESDRAVMAQAMSEVLVTDLRADIAAINIPTTVIYARDDEIPNMSAIDAFYEDLYAPLENGVVVPIDGALHFIMLDQPATFTSALEQALQQ